MVVEISQLTAEEVYRAAFGGTPYCQSEADVAIFAHHSLPRHTKRDGFRCYVAWDADTESILGFTYGYYGYTGRTGQWWHDIVADALLSEMV